MTSHLNSPFRILCSKALAKLVGLLLVFTKQDPTVIFFLSSRSGNVKKKLQQVDYKYTVRCDSYKLDNADNFQIQKILQFGNTEPVFYTEVKWHFPCYACLIYRPRVARFYYSSFQNSVSGHFLLILVYNEISANLIAFFTFLYDLSTSFYWSIIWS